VLACALVGLGVIAGVAHRRHGRARLGSPGTTVVAGVAATAVCLVAGFGSAALRDVARTEGPVADLARRHMPVTAELVVTSDPVQRGDAVLGARRVAGGWVIRARLEGVESPVGSWRVRRPVTVLAEGRAWADLLPGQRVVVRGTLVPPRPEDRVAAVVRTSATPTRVGRPPWWQRAAGRLRSGLRESAEPLPERPRGLLPGLVVGDTAGLDPALREDFRRTGMTHLVAVSGANTAVVLAVVLLLCRRAGLHPRLALVLSALALLGFVVLARPSPSVLRAAVMGGLALVATATGRTRGGLDVLCGAVLLLLLSVPSLARSPGFALSTAATLGLVVLAPGLRARLARRWPGWVADAVAVPLAAQIACAPVLALLFGRLSLVALPANILAVPAAGAATVLGVGAALLSVPCLPLARLLARAAGVPTAWLVWIAEHGARVPAGQLAWPAGWVGAGLLVVCLVGLARLLATEFVRRPVAVAVTAAVVGAYGVSLVAPGWPPPGWVLVACDVGQGDALVLRDRGHAVVVDAGPDPVAVDRCLGDLGVRTIAAVVLTHFHADHVEGLPGVLRGRRVGEVVVGPLDEPAEQRERVERWVARAGVPLRRAVVGEVRASGALRLAVLGPGVAFRGTESDPNNSSLVIRVTTGSLALLLTGDIEQPAQRAVLATGTALRADVLKVPHHGSDRQVAALLDAVGAVVAVTSVGAGNPYGHPSPETIARLRQTGLRSYRTDLDGDIAVVGGAALRVVGRLGAGAAPQPRTALASSAPARSAVDANAAGRVAFDAVRATRPAAMWCPLPSGRPVSRAPPAQGGHLTGGRLQQESSLGCWGWCVRCWRGVRLARSVAADADQR
jgi:competence protein ComEC